MFDNVLIPEELYGRVGLEQPFNPTYAIIDADNLISRSGYKANSGGNPYVKIQYLKDCQDYASITDADFNALLKRTQKDSISEVMNAVFSEADFRERNLLYQNPINKVNTTILETGFVCDKIEVARCNNIAFEIKKVILDFEGTGDITLQLYSSQQQEPLFSQLISITGTTQEQELNWKVNNVNSYKGEYYLGYITNPLLTPFKRDYNNSDITTCFTDLRITQQQFKGHSTNVIPDLTSDDGISDYNGVNADILVYDDYTDLILSSQTMFDKAIDLQFQITLIRMYLGSSRSNSSQRNAKELFVEIVSFIEGTGVDVVPRIVGLKPMLIGEISQLRKQILKQKKGLFGGMLMNQTIT